MPAPRRLSLAVADGVELSVVARRLDGPELPVLLVHGLASNARLWDGVAEAIAGAGHPVAAVDQRGHGLSSKPDHGYDFGTLGSDLEQVMEGLGWNGRRPVVAGQSWGGNVVLDMAANRPETLGALVLVDGGTIELRARFADWSTAEAALTPPAFTGTRAADVERWVRARHPTWPESGICATLANLEMLEDGTVRPWLSLANHIEILRHLWDHRPRDLYSRVRCPVTLVMADDGEDPRWMAAKRDEAGAATSALRDSELHWVEGDHDLHAQFPELVSRIVRDISARVEAPATGPFGDRAGGSPGRPAATG